MRIVYLDLDALTPSHLSCHGYVRRTSPNIDALAAEGVRLTNAYCSDAPCLPSRTALYSGRFGIQTGVVNHGGVAAQPKIQPPAMRGFSDAFADDGLARKLQDAGLHTAMISPFGQRHGAHWFYAGFNEIHNTGKNGGEIVPDVQPAVDGWLDHNATQPDWFLHVNYWDIHTPYRTPLDYGSPFAGEPVDPWYTPEVVARHARQGGPHTASDLDMYRDWDTTRYPRMPHRIRDMQTLTQWIDGYDTAIRYVDDAVGRVVETLKRLGVYDETAIIIGADHGENHGELGLYGEHATADHATCNVPMIIKWPGGASGHVCDGLHYHLDLAPTLTELLGVESPSLWDGESFADVVRGETGGRDTLVVSQCAHVCQRSARWDEDGRRWLYIRTYHDGYHLFPDHMLFDLASDPHEQHDLADKLPEVVADGVRRLASWHDTQMDKVARTYPHDAVDPMRTVLAEGGPFHAQKGHGQPGVAGFTAYMRRLRDTGRSEDADRLEAKYGT